MDVINRNKKQWEYGYCTASQYILRGEPLMSDENGLVIPARDDNSTKARCYRWLGRVLHLKKLARYGYVDNYIIGYAESCAVYDDDIDMYRVRVRL